jgi:hypothetical protein
MLADIATEITQNCSDRSSVMEIYMGSGLPHVQLALFKPILLENYAFFCFCLKNIELRQALHIDSEDLIESLDLDAKSFLQSRFEQYSVRPDSTKLYLQYCAFVINTRQNIPGIEVVDEDNFTAFESNTLLVLQLSTQRMREVAESM